MRQQNETNYRNNRPGSTLLRRTASGLVLSSTFQHQFSLENPPTSVVTLICSNPDRLAHFTLPYTVYQCVYIMPALPAAPVPSWCSISTAHLEAAVVLGHHGVNLVLEDDVALSLVGIHQADGGLVIRVGQDLINHLERVGRQAGLAGKQACRVSR